jgi:hypothetical protein
VETMGDMASTYELAEQAARAADCLSYLGRFPDIEECRSEINDGLDLCQVLTRGYVMRTSPAGVEAADVPVWRAFQKVSEGVAVDASALKDLTLGAEKVQDGLERLLRNETVEPPKLSEYRDFFLRLAVSLGL